MAHTRTFRSKKLNPDHIKVLNEAIRHNARGGDKNVHISYKKENGEVSERKVKPLAVKGKSLFVAHCHERNAIRSFRVERVNTIKQAFWNGFEKRAWFNWKRTKVSPNSSGSAKPPYDGDDFEWAEHIMHLEDKHGIEIPDGVSDEYRMKRLVFNQKTSDFEPTHRVLLGRTK